MLDYIIDWKFLGREWSDYINNFDVYRDSPYFHQLHVPLISIAIYIGSVLLLKALMWLVKSPPKLTWLVVLHNLFLSLWSLLMCIGAIFGVMHDYRRGGFNFMYCGTLVGPTFFWANMFYLSKYYELLDTVIIVMRKKPVTFLQLFHHAAVIPYFFLLDTALFTPAFIQIILNTAVHTFMYWYFAVRYLGYNPWWKRWLTTSQMIQFVLDMTLTLGVFFVPSCNARLELYNGPRGMGVLVPYLEGWSAHQTIAIGYSLGVALLILFSNFYIQTYLRRRKAGASGERSPTSSSADAKSGGGARRKPTKKDD